uniref:Uncharacterized protein n=1 Tax=Arundo donax TaxID=35708 RepID=A0A0A9BGG6_ARUDO
MAVFKPCTSSRVKIFSIAAMEALAALSEICRHASHSAAFSFASI